MDNKKLELIKNGKSPEIEYSFTKLEKVTAKFQKEIMEDLKSKGVRFAPPQDRKYNPMLLASLAKLEESDLDLLLDGSATLSNPDKIVEVATGKVLKVLEPLKMKWLAPKKEITVSLAVAAPVLKKMTQEEIIASAAAGIKAAEKAAQERRKVIMSKSAAKSADKSVAKSDAVKK